MASAVNSSSRVGKEQMPASSNMNGNVAGSVAPHEPSGGMMATIGVRVVQTLIFVYDFITFPFYLAYQKPWNATSAASSIRASAIEKTKDSITFKPIEKTCPEIEKFKVCLSNMYKIIVLYKDKVNAAYQISSSHDGIKLLG